MISPLYHRYSLYFVCHDTSPGFATELLIMNRKILNGSISKSFAIFAQQNLRK